MKLTPTQAKYMASQMLLRAQKTLFNLEAYEISGPLIEIDKNTHLLEIQIKAYNRLKNYSYNCQK